MTKKFNENSWHFILSLNVKSTAFSWKTLLNFIKIGEILVKNPEKIRMKSMEFALFSRKLKPRYLPVKNENQKKIFIVPYSTLDKLSNDISLNSLRWIYRSAKIVPQEGSEQKRTGKKVSSVSHYGSCRIKSKLQNQVKWDKIEFENKFITYTMTI